MANFFDNSETNNIVLSNAKIVLDALEGGQKIAVFALDDNEKPKNKLCDIFYRVSINYGKIPDVLEPALKYLNANYNKDIKLSYLSDLCDVSPSYFSRLFSKSFGAGLTSYVTDLRLDNACRLLKTTRRSVVSIACEVGYVDCGYFYKLFKKKYGCTPLEYRRIQIV